jgi:O-antigen/teichoic acid export membrane protein
MAGAKRFAFNVIMNWFAMAVGMVVPFFLTPFVVRSLGVTAYGIWILAVSTVSYLNVLDMGLGSAVIRFVSKAVAQDNQQEAKRAIGAALWFRFLISIAVAVLSVFFAIAFPHLFKIPSALQHAGQVTVLLCALGVAITLVSGVFGSVLSASHRYDVLSCISALQTLARAGGVILILRTGHGLVPLAYWEFAVALLGGLAKYGAAINILPVSRVGIARPESEILRAIFSYSFTTFVAIIAIQVITNTDNIVVGAFISPGMVAFYAIGGSLMAYSSQVATAVSTTFLPLASSLEAEGRSEDLQRLLLRGMQGTLAVALPISVALVIRGKTFIALWMGKQYSEISGTVIQILAISQFFGIADGVPASIVMAIDKHKPLARWVAFEAALNLGLTIVLVRTIGIYGVAWGTAIATVFVHVIFWPKYLRETLGIPKRRFLWEGWTQITLCAVPYAIVCAIADRYWRASNLFAFMAQIVVTLPVYAICVLAVFRGEAKAIYRKWEVRKAARA